jgi:hypothetical protein
MVLDTLKPSMQYAATAAKANRLQGQGSYLAGDRETLEKVQKMVSMIPGLRGSYEDKLGDLGMTILQRRRERGY